MTLNELIYEYKKRWPDHHFFDPDTLKWFGERRSEMYLWKDTVTHTDYSGEKRECYVLSSLQRKAPGGPKRVYHYFDTTTFYVMSD